jgi:hypothetical protein
MDSISVPLSRADTRDVSVVGKRGYLFEPQAELVVLFVKEAEFDPIGVLGEDRKVRTRAVIGCP